MFFIIFFALGCIWGSFSNVCIHRIPADKSVIFTRSFCPNCKKTIKWSDNIPLVSFLLLKRKCRNCDYKISFQYFIVELITAISFTIIYYFYGISITSLLLIILSVFFVIIFFIDLKHFIIPNEITFSMMALGFLKSFDPNLNSIFPNYINSLIGGLLGYGIIWSIIYFYKQVRKKEGMGLGDAKLFGVIGFWFGWIAVPFVIFISSVIALLSVVPSLLKNSRTMSSQIPFGPYIIIGTLIYLFFENIFKSLLF